MCLFKSAVFTLGALQNAGLRKTHTSGDVPQVCNVVELPDYWTSWSQLQAEKTSLKREAGPGSEQTGWFDMTLKLRRVVEVDILSFAHSIDQTSMYTCSPHIMVN